MTSGRALLYASSVGAIGLGVKSAGNGALGGATTVTRPNGTITVG